MTAIRPINSIMVVKHLRSLDIEVLDIEEYSHGIAAQNFRVTCSDGRILVVRCDARRTPEAAYEDRLFSVLCRRNGIGAPHGPWLISIINGTTMVVRPCLSGAALPDLPLSTWPSGHQLGQILCKIHAIAVPPTKRSFFYAPICSETHSRWLELRDAANCMADTPDLSVLLSNALAKANQILKQQAILQASPLSLIHGDYTPTNFLKSSTDLIVIDWEKACIGPIYSDIAQSIYYFCAACPENAREFTSSFLEGYGASVFSSTLESIRAWIALYPALIFLVDAATAAASRGEPSSAFSERRERYFLSTSALRFKRFLEMEAAILASIPEKHSYSVNR